MKNAGRGLTTIRIDALPEPVGNVPPPCRAADILKVWPDPDPLKRLRPDEFNPLIGELIASHCG